MTAPAQSTQRRQRLGLLGGLLCLAIVIVLMTPNTTSSGGGSRTSNSVKPGGTRILFELAERFGWRVQRRTAPLDSLRREATTHVVLGPSQDLGMREVHRLLDDVRAGGGLLFSMDGGEEIADSLGLIIGSHGRMLDDFGPQGCPRDRGVRDRPRLALPPEAGELKWRRPPPGPVVTLARTTERIGPPLTIAAGFPLGAGRIAVVSSSEVLMNDAIRICEWRSDIAAAQMLEYLRPDRAERPLMIFDEYHHGFGEHGGSLSVVWSYFSTTGSGRLLGQLLLAGFLVLLANAPRVIVPKERERIVRRSPLEHADALGHAYADVSATRTATRHLVAGLRRRAGRLVAIGAGATDDVFLEHVGQRFPAVASHAAVVRRGMRDALPNRELVGVGDAIRAIEEQLLAQTIKHSS